MEKTDGCHPALMHRTARRSQHHLDRALDVPPASIGASLSRQPETPNRGWAGIFSELARP